MTATPIVSFATDHGDVRVNLDQLISSRLLIQANSGGRVKRGSVELICEVCGISFRRGLSQVRRTKIGNYCSAPCRHRGHRRRLLVPCANCGKEFERPAKEATRRNKTVNYCSTDCFKAAHVAKPHVYRKSGDRHAHRGVAEAKIGRALLPREVVHHIDGDKHNNHPDNIAVLPNRAIHSRLHIQNAARDARGRLLSPQH